MIVKKRLIYIPVTLLFYLGIVFPICAQEGPVGDTTRIQNAPVDTVNTFYHYDIGDAVYDIFHRRERIIDTLKTPSGISFVPNVAYNPTIGLQGGIKAMAGRVLGNEPNTTMSVAATTIAATTKGILVFYLNHNVFTPGNTYNVQGIWRAAKVVMPDYGLGSGPRRDEVFEKDGIPINNTNKVHVLHYTSFTFNEKVFKNIGKNFYLGGGLSFDIKSSIDDRSLASDGNTPHFSYSNYEGISPNRYVSNGILLDVQYVDRDHPNSARRGIYADIGIRANQRWMGSTRTAYQATVDFRKYWSLSKRKPDHVLAFWHWSSYLLSGTLPYFDLPGTASDFYSRTGRGYTFGRFRGPQFFYLETEYRFPITKNKFLGGVVFANMQSASNVYGTKLFDYWEPAGGAGLRVLFNKHTRTYLCLDYAVGKYGARGFFLGLNEAF
ncbi:BamA/TamA family outer membrane protein [Olivibacter sitiensis]|uniref:BamA/TamA family outer membrane protein n=1 Tax=Olivibacter sitiensis TaxID=376470 RepID=UPI00041A9E75|nr:BamA/TamA family outer membrane protein [Olivibacter sitiensis]